MLPSLVFLKSLLFRMISFHLNCQLFWGLSEGKTMLFDDFPPCSFANWLELINKSLKCGWTVRAEWQLGQGFVDFLNQRAASSLEADIRLTVKHKECLHKIHSFNQINQHFISRWYEVLVTQLFSLVSSLSTSCNQHKL